MPHVDVSKQSFNTLIIIIGAGLLIYDFTSNTENVFFKISGLVILMFGLYKSTQQWTTDNKAEEDQQDKTIDKIDDFGDDIELDDDNIKNNGQ